MDRPLDLGDEAIAARELLAAVRAGSEILAEDEQLVLESETNLVEALAEAVSDLAELEALCAGLKAVMQTQAVRLRRFGERHGKIRAAIKKAFERADLRSPVVLPEATLSMGNGPRKVVIVEREHIPLLYRRQPEWEPDKEMIGKDLRYGIPVHGAVLGNPELTLTIKRS